MSFEEMVVALVGAVGAFALVGYLATKIFGLIQSWINRNNSSITEEDFNRLGKAFVEYKKNTERRLQNLEAIIAGDDSGSNSDQKKSSKRIEAPRNTIEIEDSETEEKEKGNSGSGQSSNLRNMLRE